MGPVAECINFLNVEGQEGLQDEESRLKKYPFFMLIISAIEIACYEFGNYYLLLVFCYDPYRRHELWRFLTVMLTHVSRIHLWGNIIFQLILGVLLEVVHHWKRIGAIYLSSIVGGTIAISLFHPTVYAMGASAGNYGLLMAHVVTITLNWNEMNQKRRRVFWLLAFIAFDIGLSIYLELYSKIKHPVSHAGHFGGALTGFLVSALLLKNFVKHHWEKTFQKFCAGILILLLVVAYIVNIAFPSLYSPSRYDFQYEATSEEHLFNVIEKTPEGSESRKQCEENEDCKKGLTDYRIRHSN